VKKTRENMNNTDTKGVNVSGVVVEICGSFFIVLEHVFAIFLISKCRIVQTSVKILVTNLCTIDIIAGFWGCIRATLRFYLTDERMLCMLDILLTTWVFNVSAFLVSAIAIDRYISVFFPMKYTSIVDKSVFGIACFVMWSLGAVLSVVTLFIEFSYTKEKGCAIRMSQQEVFPWILVSLRFICICIIAYSYSRMYMKILSLGKRYAGMKRIELRSIAKILLIVTPHLILHAFYIVMFLFQPVFNIHKSLMYESLFTTAVIFVDTWIYVVRFKECRINMAIYLCYCRRGLCEENIKKRKLLYGTFLDIDNPDHQQTSI
jgi:hypothetical protein